MTPIGGVVLAAGLSRRMGREKVLLRLGGATPLERVIDGLKAAGVAQPIVVLREDLTEGIALAGRRGARVVVNAHPEDEMLLSIRLGIAALAASVDVFFVWPADHPAVAADTLRGLLARAAPERVVIPVYRGHRGHPALVGRALLGDITAIPPGEGLHRLWRDRPEVLEEFAVADEGVVLDMNTPEDYARVAAKLSANLSG